MDSVQLFAKLLRQYLDARNKVRRLSHRQRTMRNDFEFGPLTRNYELMFDMATVQDERGKCYFLTEGLKRAAIRREQKFGASHSYLERSSDKAIANYMATEVLERGAELRAFFRLEKEIKRAQKEKYKLCAALQMLSRQDLEIRVTFGGDHKQKTPQDMPNVYWGERKMSAKQFLQEAEFERIVFKIT